ncbi:MAG TPA: amidase, partial [Acidimicrobiales bacterium]|nr:amidase [Acidimicrobiales bacterium]
PSAPAGAPTAAQLAAEYREGSRSPGEAVEELLDRIAREDGELRAFRTVLGDEARREASLRHDELLRGQARGPLHGIPVAIKELFDVAGAPLSYGSRLFAGRIAQGDATAVTRLRSAGAIVIGVTRSHEFGWGITTQHPDDGGTRNPYDYSRVPGGSSGGSAAAVAAGFVPLALGSDTGGSIRIPASFCGVAGLKPTFGAISSEGAVPLAFSLDHPGPIAGCVGDLATAFRALCDVPPAEPGTARSPRRVGVAPGLHWPQPSDDVAALFWRCVEVLSELGIEIVELDLGSSQPIRQAFATIQMAEALHVHRELLGTFPGRAAEYGADVRGRLEAAQSVALSDYLAARRAASAIRRRFDEALRQVDALLTPVAAGGPSSISDADTVLLRGEAMSFRDLVMNYTTPQDLTGLPALSLPVGLDRDGLPVGMQLTAAAGAEVALLRLAGDLEAAVQFRRASAPREIGPRPAGSGAAQSQPGDMPRSV